MLLRTYSLIEITLKVSESHVSSEEVSLRLASLCLQAFALVGCLVTGTLARRRRLEVEGLNNRLRQINTELMKRGTVEVSPAPCCLQVKAMQAPCPQAWVVCSSALRGCVTGPCIASWKRQAMLTRRHLPDLG